MKNALFASLPAAMLLAGGSATLSADDSDAANIPPAVEFAPVQRYNITYDAPRDVAEFYLRDFGFRTRDAEFQQADHPTDPTMLVMLVTVDGIRDDSVRGVQLRLGMRASAGFWEMVEAGIRRKCHRGENAGKWTREVCP
ncbi:hypothetical protein [Erythrobacter sp. THAF29]|uniref:hypothetical protein n=1 Tax=Erythrobacter sp. THAF29 TaxID=2587851 RepID=UPI0012686D0F|nr:hypothetical protein [Erythrobacter sp. THAF29]QFT76421.1 hypothetical protein FIU90_02580 [Erythrobacter sp. THAF29]